MKKRTESKRCRYCGRIDNGAPRCRDHPAEAKGAFTLLSELDSDDTNGEELK